MPPGMPCITAADDAERKTEQLQEFPMPVPDQTGGRNNEDSLQKPAGEHLPDVETGHNGLPCARIVRQEKAKPALLQHMIINGDALMREGIDAGDFRGEGGIHHVAEGESFAFGKDFYDLRPGSEIKHGRRWFLVFGFIRRRFFL